MRIIRQDIVGTIDMRLVKRPTNTAVGVDNWSLYAVGCTDNFPAPIVRFLSTDQDRAVSKYNAAIAAAQELYEERQ